MVRALAVLLAPVVAVLMAVTFALYFNAFAGTPLYNVLAELNLRWERTVGVWAESVIFLICAMSFAPIGWADPSRSGLRVHETWFFRLVAIGLCFFAVDEYASIHELAGRLFERQTRMLEGTSLDRIGFSWVVLYGPACVFALYGIFRIIRKMISAMPAPEGQERLAIRLLWGSCGCALMIPLFEIAESYLWSLGSKETVLLCFEESFELLALYGFILCTNLVARRYDL